jgi:hypothetical protein
MFFDGSSSSRKEVNLGGKRKGLAANAKDKASFVEQVTRHLPLLQILPTSSFPSNYSSSFLQVSSLRAEREVQRRSENRWNNSPPRFILHTTHALPHLISTSPSITSLISFQISHAPSRSFHPPPPPPPPAPPSYQPPGARTPSAAPCAAASSCARANTCTPSLICRRLQLSHHAW